MFKPLACIVGLLYFLSSLHFFQWKGYFYKRYLKYLIKNKLIIIFNCILIFQILINILNFSPFFSIFILNNIILIINTFILFIFLISRKKINFIFTFRIFRLFLMFCFTYFILYFTNKYVLLFSIILIPILIIVLDLLDTYKYIQDNKCLNTAIKKLENNKNLIVIGITGSNGKTSIKEILTQLLSIKYKVITTQKNQNTLKGAIIAINKFLNTDTQIFICEMGARCIGDIKKICNFVNPNLGIISTVSPQHLETFKTEKNIYLTKKELADYLNENYCVFNIDNEQVLQMYEEKIGKKSSISINSKSDLYASNIHIVNYHTYFDIHYNSQIYPCHTNLLGEHNVTNILLALNLALHLGIDINSAIQKIISLSPTPHRLEYIKSHIDIIDDSYNCSINSAKMAINVLKSSPKFKIICTPGIIEGGKKQYELNSQLSSMINEVADCVIIVGKTNRFALISKLKDFELIYIEPDTIYNKLIHAINKNSNKIKRYKNYFIKQVELKNIIPSTKKCAYIVNSLEYAKKLFTKLINKNQVLLILNDLPDEYN